MRVLAKWLRRLADRIDPRGASRFTHWSFTFEEGEGIRFREDGRGCPVAYVGEGDYERAHAEAGPMPFGLAVQRMAAGLSEALEPGKVLRAGFEEYGRRMAEINSRPGSPPSA